MSMSQEEIEALMNGADGLSGDDSSDSSSASDDTTENLDDILAGIEGIEDDGSSSEDTADATENLDDILAGIEGIEDDTPAESSSEENFDDILAGIEGISDDEPSASSSDTSENPTAVIEEMIDEAKYPLPVEKEHKVVSQLNEVAEDSERKASQIFDVLSFILDENAEEQNFTTEVKEYLDKQIELLESLSTKFPNIEIFKENLESSNKLKEATEANSSRIDGENNKIFEAMELMQYHDINRQKIERVMAVIKKLNDYLNGIFEDDTGKPDVQIAKHISGDANDTVDADDLEALIDQFSTGEEN